MFFKFPETATSAASMNLKARTAGLQLSSESLWSVIEAVYSLGWCIWKANQAGYPLWQVLSSPPKPSLMVPSTCVVPAHPRANTPISSPESPWALSTLDPHTPHTFSRCSLSLPSRQLSSPPCRVSGESHLGEKQTSGPLAEVKYSRVCASSLYTLLIAACPFSCDNICFPLLRTVSGTASFQPSGSLQIKSGWEGGSCDNLAVS